MDNNTNSNANPFEQDYLPKGATPMQDFDVGKFMGKWYEMARLDFQWENGNYTNVCVEYEREGPNQISVNYKAYDKASEQWGTGHAKAKFRGSENIGALEISYLGFGWDAYNVLSADDEYQYALVVGSDTKHMWILSRDKELPENIKKKYIEMANNLGFPVSQLDWTDQSMSE